MKYKINPNRMFSGALSFLSNMYACNICLSLNGKEYTFHTSEAAFQAGKCLLEKDIQLIANTSDGATAKRLGRKVAMRPDWDGFRLTWMREVVNAKFRQNPDLMQALVGTYPLHLVETNTWKDTFWGVCNGIGENHLGKILMEVREAERCRQKP